MVATFTLGCGKKADEEGSEKPRYTEPQIADLDLELSKQELFCGGSEYNCPSYLTKIAIVYKDKLKFCTGFLTQDNVVATASSCLPEALRAQDAVCEKDIFSFLQNQIKSQQELVARKSYRLLA